MGKRNDELIIILDIDRVFSSGELDGFQSLEKTQEIENTPVAAPVDGSAAEAAIQ